MKTTEQIEVTIEDLTADIKRLNEFLEYTLNSKLDSEIKREFAHRLEKEIEWFEQIKQDEIDALNYKDLAEEIEFEEYRLKKFEKNAEILEKINEDGNEMFNKKESE